ncbi:sialate O-acetylesterase [Saonia flava]|uniref:Sialate O-acetylesterase n=1 Tax=Saonia flava TaxID=523696 RepID=A0A846R0E3_9FLAO|nr:sialate O-acetylesterase [Saonia flava]NJB70339.1 sialate O-acetylesterase [Saonia flava]
MKFKYAFFLLACILSINVVSARVVLPRIFSNDMVLQRNSDVLLWGWGNVSEEITIVTSWDGKEYKAKGTTDAKWKVEVTTPEAGGPYTISFKGWGNEIVLNNVLIGEVWLASGQSNMEWSANSGIVHMDEVDKADYPNIRLFTVDRRTAAYPQDDLSGSWKICTPESMKHFSAVAYFFAKRLYGELDIPIGVINSSWGASSAEVWTPKSVFDINETLKESAKKIEANQWVSNKTSELFNAMISPITSYKIAGALWYQGESNTANHEIYTELFTSMITSWREQWGYSFPFYFVQIAPFNYGEPEQGVKVRDAQRRTLALKNTGMVVVSDICTVDDIHPRNKLDVGNRLANIALKDHYETLEVEVHSPLFKELIIEGKKATVIFDHSKGLYAKGKKVTHFEIAGDKDQFYPAKAIIKNDRVIVSSKEVKEPKKVRFAWNNRALPNLFNEANLPASSFISD